MRVALDLQACQTASRLRGIGRYTMDFTRALLAREGAPEYLLCLDGTYPKEAQEVVADLEARVQRASFSRYFYPGATHPHGSNGDRLRPAASILVASHYTSLAPDVVHANSIFEGFLEHASGVPGLSSVPGAVSSATLYDLIPLVFEDRYLADPKYRAWYYGRLADIQRFDLLLCISEATRNDAIRLLGVDPDKLVVIHAGVGDEFVPKQWHPGERAAMLRRLGIRDRFVLYTGNGDFRKNLHGAIESFAMLPTATRAGIQLVLNQVDDPKALRRLAQRAGLGADDLVITGKVSNADLLGLFQNCEVFFFPSLYEGFGLPVLEAMACGAPTICADNSSLKEVVGRPDGMFDARDPASGAQLMAAVLDDMEVRTALRESGLRRAREYTWERTALLARQAWTEAAESKRKDAFWRRTGQGRRQRMAMVTPLPPERTGIADYVAQTLIPLSQHFDLDLFTSADIEATGSLRHVFPTYRWSSLPELIKDYDIVVYQLGNSPFHMHMLQLLAEFPGVVVLHDVYLSSMLAYMDANGHEGLFARELMHAHGRGAVDFLARNGMMEARVRYPMSLRVIEQADAIIVHSRHSAETIDRFFPLAQRGKVFSAPMPIRVAPGELQVDRAAARARLGLPADECVIVSFGFLAETKLNHLVMDALHGLESDHARVHMVFVGQNDGGEYGRALAAAVKTMDRAGRVRVDITGFADAQLYNDYLVAGDIAVQLRADSRGETSKAIYDCLAHGLPTIANDYGSFAELPSDCIWKLPAVPEADQIAQAFRELIGDTDRRERLGASGRRYIEKHHTPSNAAGVYAKAVRGAHARRAWRSGEDLALGLGRTLQPGVGDNILDALEYSICRREAASATPRLMLDLSEVIAVDHGTGIHRVVRNLARELMLAEHPSLFRTGVVAHDASGAMRSAEDYAVRRLGVPAAAEADRAWSSRDVLLMLDSAWEGTSRFDTTIAELRAAGGCVAALVYDLIPLRFPKYCVDYMPAVFESWLRYVVKHCNHLICISDATAFDLKAWIAETGAEQYPGQRIGHVHLGCDLIEPGRREAEMDEAFQQVFEGWTALVVGTLEPRKGCVHVLEAFEARWRNGSEQKLVFFGKKGWNIEDFVERVQSHPEFGKRLFWFQGLSDAELSYAYQRASTLIQASFAEGFGLPIVEASRYRLPLLLSDLPVFREIATHHASYFRAGDSTELAELLDRPLPAPPPADLGLTWQQSAQTLLHFLMGAGRVRSC